MMLILLLLMRPALMPLRRAHGHLDVLVANAGILGQMQPAESVEEDNWRNVFAVNVVSVQRDHCCRPAALHFFLSSCTHSLFGLDSLWLPGAFSKPEGHKRQGCIYGP